MFSNVLFKIQDKLKYLYYNSKFLQHIDFFILLSIVAVIVSSVFFDSDTIGFVALCAVFLTIVKMITTPNEKFTFNKFELFLVTYFMFVIISLAGSSLFALSFKGFLKTFTYIGFYFSAAHYFKNNRSNAFLVIFIIALCTTFESLVALVQNFHHVEAISTWQDTSMLNQDEIMTRVYGTLKPFNPNLLGGYFVAGIPSILAICALSFYKRDLKRVLVFGIFLLLSVLGLFSTGCRGAYLALFVILLLAFAVSVKFLGKSYKKVYFSIVAAITAVFTFAFCYISSLRARFISIFAMRNDSSNSFRFNVYHSSLEMFKDNWLLGIGVGNRNFREIYGLYMKTGFDALSAYNIFLEIAVESGIFALLAFLGFLILLIKDSLKLIFNSNNFEQIIFVATAIISVIAVMFHGFVDTIFFRPQIQFVFWTMVAVICANIHKSCSEDVL